MKRTIFFLLLAIFAFSCNKDEKAPKSTGTATVNGEMWEAVRVMILKSPRSENKLYFVADFDQYGYAGGLTIDGVEKNYSKQQILKTKYDSLFLINGRYINSQEYDVTGDEYHILESDSLNNWVQITSAKDDFTKDIKGEFSATLVRTKAFQNSPYPDTLRIRNGSFNISKLWDRD